MIYLDHAATTPLDERVLTAMLPALEGRYGNAASPHSSGRAALLAVEYAREQVAALAGVRPSRVVWTSGSTEAINTALKALGRDGLAVWNSEHKAVLDTADWLRSDSGAEVITIPTAPFGQPLLPERFGVPLAVVMAGNNESGVTPDIPEIAHQAAAEDTSLFVDFTQAAGRVSYRPGDLPGDVISCLSAHKICGPQGIGALILPPKNRDRIVPLLHGGGHEAGHRSGTLNVAGIIGFGAAAELAADPTTDQHVSDVRDRFERRLAETLSDVRVNFKNQPRLPHISSITIGQVDAEALIANARQVAFATGSACTSAVPTPSHVLLAADFSTTEAEQTARFSVGRFTTKDDVDAAAASIVTSAGRVRSLL